MSCAVCSAASASRPAHVTLSVWIRAFLPWQRTSAKIFSTPAICCLVTMCQSTLLKGRHRITRFLIADVGLIPSPSGRGVLLLPPWRGKGGMGEKGGAGALPAFTPTLALPHRGGGDQRT